MVGLVMEAAGSGGDLLCRRSRRNQRGSWDGFRVKCGRDEPAFVHRQCARRDNRPGIIATGVILGRERAVAVVWPLNRGLGTRVGDVDALSCTLLFQEGRD